MPSTLLQTPKSKKTNHNKPLNSEKIVYTDTTGEENANGE